MCGRAPGASQRDAVAGCFASPMPLVPGPFAPPPPPLEMAEEVAARAWQAVKPHYESLDAAVAPRVFAFAESLGLKVRPISPLVRGLPLIDSPTPLLLLLVRRLAGACVCVCGKLEAVRNAGCAASWNPGGSPGAGPAPCAQHRLENSKTAPC